MFFLTTVDPVASSSDHGQKSHFAICLLSATFLLITCVQLVGEIKNK